MSATDTDRDAGTSTPSEHIELTVRQVALRLQVKPHRVIKWIANGELAATNVGDKSRPYWRINLADLLAWQAARRSKPVVRPPQRRRRKAIAGPF